MALARLSPKALLMALSDNDRFRAKVWHSQNQHCMQLRRGIEGLPPKQVAGFSYYEKWAASAAEILLERRIISRHDLDAALGVPDLQTTPRQACCGFWIEPDTEVYVWGYLGTTTLWPAGMRASWHDNVYPSCCLCPRGDFEQQKAWASMAQHVMGAVCICNRQQLGCHRLLHLVYDWFNSGIALSVLSHPPACTIPHTVLRIVVAMQLQGRGSGAGERGDSPHPPEETPLESARLPLRPCWDCGAGVHGPCSKSRAAGFPRGVPQALSQACLHQLLQQGPLRQMRLCLLPRLLWQALLRWTQLCSVALCDFTYETKVAQRSRMPVRARQTRLAGKAQQTATSSCAPADLAGTVAWRARAQARDEVL